MKKQINEAFASKKLSDLVKKHGGIKSYYNGGIRDGIAAYVNGYRTMASELSDDMIGDVFYYNDGTFKQQENAVVFNDGSAVEIINNGNLPKKVSKPNKYGTGIGDTGDHNRKPSPFFKDAKIDKGPEYNGFSVSSRAGESQHYREAFNNNKEDYEYFKSHPERSDSKEGMKKAASNMSAIRGYGRNLLNRRKNESKQSKNYITESTFFLKNDSIFPRDIAMSIKQYAENLGVQFYYKGDYITIRIVFSDMFESHESITAYGVKVNNDGLLNYWIDEIYDGRHRCSGPGYPSNAIFPQEPVTKEKFLNIVKKEIESKAKRIKQYETKNINKENNVIKINESQLQDIIKESIERILKEK